MPVATVDSHKIGDGVPGPVTSRLIDAFADSAGIDFVSQAKVLQGLA